MASEAAINGRRQEEEEEEEAKTLKEGESILAPTRRPDGTLRKPVRIRAGYVPQDEVAVYKSKGALALLKKKESVPPGYDPEEDAVNKPKTKSAKRNERKKEKRLQGKNEVPSTEDSIVSQMKEITVSGNTREDNIPDIDKRIRALKKKIRLIEAQQQKMGMDLKPEQLDKVAKLEDWRVELNALEDRKASIKGD